MVPIHLDIFLGSSIQADSPKTTLLDNWIEVSTGTQPDKHWAICDGVIQGRPLTCTCSAPGFQSLGQSLERKNEGYFSAEQGRSICLTSLTTMWPVKLIQNYWSPEGEAPQQKKVRHVNTKDEFMEKWIRQNTTRAGPKIQSRWWKGKEKAYINVTFYQRVVRRAFTTSTQLQLQRGLISLEGVPCGQDRTEGCASPRSSQSFKPSWQRQTATANFFADRSTCSFEAVYSKS